MSKRHHGEHAAGAKHPRYSQTYLREWESDSSLQPWLTKSSKGPAWAFCKFCNCDLKIEKGGKKDLERHNETEKHRTNSRSVTSVPKITTLVPTNPRKDQVRAEIIQAYFIAEHNLPMMLANHLSVLYEHMFPDSKTAKAIESKKDKTTQIIKNVIAPEFHSILVAMMHHQPFSLLLDETTDVSVTKQACLVVRIFDRTLSAVKSYFYRLVEVPNADAGTLFEVIKNVFELDGVSFDNLIGFGADGANVMLGKRNSVLTHLKGVQPHLFFLHCTCHCAHLCASGACKMLPKSLEQLVRSIYNHFHLSPKRMSRLSEFQHFTDTIPHKLLAPSQTRWLSLEMCIKRILEQWDALRAYFMSDSDDVVDSIGEKLSDSLNHLYMIFLATILPMFTSFNKLFQQESPNIHVVYSESYDLLCSFIGNLVKPQVLSTVVNVIDIDQNDSSVHLPDSCIFIGHKARQYLQLAEEEGDLSRYQITEFYTCVKKFYMEAIAQLKKRLPVRDSVMKELKILDPCNRALNPSLNSMTSRFPQIVKEEDLDALELEWRSFLSYDISSLVKDAVNSDTGAVKVDLFWANLSEIKKYDGSRKFPLLSSFMQALLSLPHSNADTERIFSQLKLIKSDHRNRLHVDTLNALLTIKCNVKTIDCYRFEPSDAMIRRAMDSSQLY